MELLDKTVDGLTFQVSPQMERAGIAHGFTTRTGGVSGDIFSSLNLAVNREDRPENVRENYCRVCGA